MLRELVSGVVPSISTPLYYCICCLLLSLLCVLALLTVCKPAFYPFFVGRVHLFIRYPMEFHHLLYILILVELHKYGCEFGGLV
jgi:hypothetical protein